MIRNYPADNTAKLFKVTTLIYNNWKEERDWKKMWKHAFFLAKFFLPWTCLNALAEKMARFGKWSITSLLETWSNTVWPEMFRKSDQNATKNHQIFGPNVEKRCLDLLINL
jgi:hypothetical protein